MTRLFSSCLVLAMLVSALSEAEAKPGKSNKPSPRPSPSAAAAVPPAPAKPVIVESQDPATVARIGQELTRLRTSKPEGPARWVEESRLLYYQGLASPSKEDRRSFFDQGRQLAAKAREAEPKNPAAIAWWAGNEANYADAVANLSALKSLSKVEDALLELRKIDGDFEGGAADRGLGRLYHKAPSFISVGSTTRAMEAFRRAMDKHPEHPGNRVYLAQFQAERGKCEEARSLASSVYNSKDLAKHPFDAPAWNVIAAEILLGKIEKCPAAN